MVRTALVEYGAPLAVSLTLAVGGVAVTTSTKVAVLESETKNMVQVQREMVKEIKVLSKVIHRVDAKMEAQYGQGDRG